MSTTENIRRDPISMVQPLLAHAGGKATTRTSELLVYLAAVVAVVLASVLVGDKGPRTDPFSTAQAMQYVTFLTIGYLISRGLAKSGSRNNDGT